MTDYCRTCGLTRGHWNGCSDIERAFPVTHLAGRLAVQERTPTTPYLEVRQAGVLEEHWRFPHE